MTSAVLQSKTAATAGASSLVVSFPTAPATGSVLLLAANSPQGIATPAGWTLRASFAGDQGFYLWDKVSAGSGDLTVTVTPNNPASVAATLLELNAVNVTVFDVHSTVNGTSAANNIPCSSVTTTGLYGADVIAVGAIHGWAAGTPDPVPAYTGGFAHLATALAPGTGSTLVGQYAGEKVTDTAGASGGTIISQAAILDNTAGFLIAYSRTAPLVIVPIVAVNSATGWTLSGETSALAALTDANDVSQLATADLVGGSAAIDVTLGSMEKPPTSFVVRVRAKKDAASATVTGRLYDGATLLATSDTRPVPTGYGDILLTFPAGQISPTDPARWIAGLRLTVSATAS